jgi:MFS family permease
MTQATRDRIFHGWWVVLASMIGLGMSVAALLLWTFGVFLKPVTEEFGWSRTEYSAAVLFSTLALVLASPVVGRLVDRHGARRVALGSGVLLAIAFGSMALLTPAVGHFYAMFAVCAVAGAGTSSVVYAHAISSWFDRRRGLALGLALAGIGLGALLLPSLAQALIGAFGWRRAYLSLAVIAAAISLPVGFLLLRNSPSELGLAPDGGRSRQSDGSAPVASAGFGLTTRQAVRTPTFWLIAVAFGLAGFAVTGPSLHFVAMLSDRGIPPVQAAAAASLSGLGLLVGRILAGHLMDRYFAPRVAIFFLLVPAGAMLLLTTEVSSAVAIACGAAFGLALGAEVDIVAFLTSRYFGMRCFGGIYGLQYATFTAAAGVAPVVTGLGYDLTGSYRSILFGFAVVLLFAIALITRIGPYPDWSARAT